MKKLTAIIIIIFFGSYSSYCQQKKFVEIKAAMEEKFTTERQNGREEKPKDNAYAKYKRWEWWAERHLNQQGFIVNDVVKSYEIYEKYNSYSLERNSSLLSIGGNWTELVHTPYGTNAMQMGKGRIDCIVEIPGTFNVLVGTVSGGVWKGTRANISAPFSWFPLSDGIARLSITDICINPNNTNEIYIATGSGDGDGGGANSNSFGVLKSTDGGVNWNRTSLNFLITENRRIYRMIMDPTDPQIMYAATDNGIFRTENGWNTRTTILAGGWTDLKFKPDDNETLFCVNNSNIWRINDNGAGNIIFTYPLTQERLVLGVTPANGEYLYVLGGISNTGFTGLYKCTNSGATSPSAPSFTLQSTTPDILSYSTTGMGEPNGQVFYDIVIAVHPLNAERIFAGGLNLWESTNGGATWTVRTDWKSVETNANHCHSDYHQLKFNSQNNLYNCNDGGLFTMNLANNSWAFNSSGVNNTQYYRISTITQAAGDYIGRLIIGGTQDNGTLRSRNNELRKVRGGDGMDNAMASVTGLQLVAANQNGGLAISINGGSTFLSPTIAPAQNNEGAWVTPIVQHCTLPEYIYVGYKNVYFNEDNSNWDEWSDVINTNFPNPIIAMCQGNYTTQGQPGTNVIYCAVNISTVGPASYYLYRIENNLVSTKTELRDFSNVITSVKCDPNNARNVYVTLGGFGNNHKVYYSSDRGQSWTNISGELGADGSFPDLPANCIALKDGGNGGIYVGTDIGVYFRQNANAGEKWTLFSNGLPNVPVTDLEIDVTTNEIFAATYGRGLWKSDLHESCLSVLNVSGNTTGVTYYEAFSTINSSSTTSGGYGNKITLNAGEEVNLTDGFEVKEGSAMWAYIQGCNDPRNGPLFDKTAKKKKANQPVKKKIKKSGQISVDKK